MDGEEDWVATLAPGAPLKGAQAYLCNGAMNYARCLAMLANALASYGIGRAIVLVPWRRRLRCDCCSAARRATTLMPVIRALLCHVVLNPPSIPIGHQDGLSAIAALPSFELRQP